MLLGNYSNIYPEAGCDEAGRGCLAGPVVAAAVILPPGFQCPKLNDSKKLNPKTREELREIIKEKAIAYSVAFVDHYTIDNINILKASILAMHNALKSLKIQPEFIIVDGNKFDAYKKIPHQCIIKGDSKYASIAAASILAKTERDDYMKTMHKDFPIYGWDTNFGYPTAKHRNAIIAFGISSIHRKSFNTSIQLKLSL